MREIVKRDLKNLRKKLASMPKNEVTNKVSMSILHESTNQMTIYQKLIDNIKYIEDSKDSQANKLIPCLERLQTKWLNIADPFSYVHNKSYLDYFYLLYMASKGKQLEEIPDLHDIKVFMRFKKAIRKNFIDFRTYRLFGNDPFGDKDQGVRTVFSDDVLKVHPFIEPLLHKELLIKYLSRKYGGEFKVDTPLLSIVNKCAADKKSAVWEWMQNISTEVHYTLLQPDTENTKEVHRLVFSKFNRDMFADLEELKSNWGIYIALAQAVKKDSYTLVKTMEEYNTINPVLKISAISIDIPQLLVTFPFPCTDYS